MELLRRFLLLTLDKIKGIGSKIKEVFNKIQIVIFFPYLVRIKEQTLYNHKIKGCKIKKDKDELDYLLIYTNKLSIRYMTNNNIDFEIVKNLKKIVIKFILLKRLLIVVSSILIISLFIFTNDIIRNVKFSNQSTYDKRVYDFVINDLSKKGIFYIMDKDLNVMSQSLRINFPEFAYIGLRKHSSILIIDINKHEKKNDVKKKYYESFISSSNGLIKHIYVEKGKCSVILNQMVKKGELLINNINNVNNIEQENSSNELSYGIIIANILSIIDVKVRKKIDEYEYTSNMKTRFNIGINHHNIFLLESYFPNQEVYIKETSFLSGLISLYQEYYYELSDIMISHNDESSLNYAMSKIRCDFFLEQVSDLEVINDIELLKSKEDSNYYYFTFLVNMDKNIAIGTNNSKIS